MPALALGDPAALLRRRPDIRAAERALAAATARIGVQTADLFPRVTFVGSVGLQADTFAGLGKSGADTWNFGPRITWAALDLGRIHARIKAADARTEGSLDFYERTVLTALEETEGALVDFGQEQSRQQCLPIYLAKLPRVEKKLRVALDWTLDLFFPKDFVQHLTVHGIERVHRRLAYLRQHPIVPEQRASPAPAPESSP